MADIAFLLLVFFLVTTSMNSEVGLMRKLPPAIESDGIVQDRNILKVLINANDQLLVDGRRMELTELKPFAKHFIANPENLETLPSKKETEVPLLGSVAISKQVISLQSDLNTSYGMYVAVQDMLASAYMELRNEYAMRAFNESYQSLAENGQEERVSSIRTVYPMRISEAELNQR